MRNLPVLLDNSSVQHRTGDATKWLQKGTSAMADGIIGLVTRSAVESRDKTRLYRAVLAQRIRYYGRLITDDNARERASRDGYDLQAVFAAGWMNRISEFVEGES